MGSLGSELSYAFCPWLGCHPSSLGAENIQVAGGHEGSACAGADGRNLGGNRYEPPAGVHGVSEDGGSGAIRPKKRELVVLLCY